MAGRSTIDRRSSASNGRTFDIPLLELAAFRYGISIPAWFALTAKSFDQPRNRFNLEDHLDLQEVLTNFGSTRFNGGLNLAANLLGKPARWTCRETWSRTCSTAARWPRSTTTVAATCSTRISCFSRSRVLVGLLTLAQEHTIIEQTKAWLEEHAATQRAYRMYLDRWGDWPNPWGHVAGSPKSGR